MRIYFDAFGREFLFKSNLIFRKKTEEKSAAQVAEEYGRKAEYERWREEVCNRPLSPDTAFPPGHED